MSAVINNTAFARIKGYIDEAKSNPDVEVIAGGVYDDSVGYFVNPTILVTKDVNVKTMKEEIFGPVLTVFIYPSAEYEKV
jgi:1-pyrroline-5-carboxylate dehydrogenase